jgi:site-specific DNA-methyltransferase (adenine-specific)/adenine-specific DNA-methyltransferase
MLTNKNMNDYIIGDNLEMLSKLKEKNIKIDLIYFDPPYNTGRDFNDFDDRYENYKSYREDFIKPRLEIMYDLLSKNGLVVVHVEPSVSHHIRIVLDEVFGEKNFRNEIVWKSGGNKKSTKKLMRFHDTIIVYSKTPKFTYNPQSLPYDESYRKNNTIKKDINGEYTTSAAHNSQPNVVQRPNLRYEWNGHYKQWWWSKDKMEELHSQNRLEYNKNGVPRVKKYLHEMDGIPVRDLWLDINQIQGNEKLDYATQKPVKLLERIVSMFSNKGDLVLDPFAGSGTTGRACMNTGRNYILLDINPKGKEIFKNCLPKK